MRRQQWLLLGLGGAILAYLYLNRQQLQSAAGTALSAGEALLEGWQNAGEGPTWVPVINQTEASLGIPPNLLARMAYQESRFRQSVIDGTTPSPAGALGILQLMPQYFKSVQVPRPFTPADTQAQITEAGQDLASLYNTFGDWATALAAYNWGPGNVQEFLAGTLSGIPTETQNYVKQILADVPVADPATILNA
jgi:soluble lytic murein transglycosylase-like protein